MAVAGMGEPQGERTVVGEQQGAAAVGVETTDRMEAAAVAQLRGADRARWGGPGGRGRC